MWNTYTPLDDMLPPPAAVGAADGVGGDGGGGEVRHAALLLSVKMPKLEEPEPMAFTVMIDVADAVQARYSVNTALPLLLYGAAGYAPVAAAQPVCAVLRLVPIGGLLASPEQVEHENVPLPLTYLPLPLYAIVNAVPAALEVSVNVYVQVSVPPLQG